MKEDISKSERETLLRRCEELHVTEAQVVAALVRAWVKDPVNMSIDLDVCNPAFL